MTHRHGIVVAGSARGLDSLLVQIGDHVLRKVPGDGVVGRDMWVVSAGCPQHPFRPSGGVGRAGAAHRRAIVDQQWRHFGATKHLMLVVANYDQCVERRAG